LSEKKKQKEEKKEIGIAGFTTSIMRQQQEFSGTACMVPINGRNLVRRALVEIQPGHAMADLVAVQ
jgi:hypothetical protein